MFAQVFINYVPIIEDCVIFDLFFVSGHIQLAWF